MGDRGQLITPRWLPVTLIGAAAMRAAHHDR